MIELFDADIKADNRRSSKGNQLKWERNGYWCRQPFEQASKDIIPGHVRT